MDKIIFKQNRLLYSANFILPIFLVGISFIMLLFLITFNLQFYIKTTMLLVYFVLPLIYAINLFFRLIKNYYWEIEIIGTNKIIEKYKGEIKRKVFFSNINNIAYFEDGLTDVNLVSCILTTPRGSMLMFPKYGRLGRKMIPLAKPMLMGFNEQGGLLSYYPPFILDYKKFIKYYVDRIPNISVDPAWKNYCNFL